MSPELLFGRGLGELFIVRNAGNTIDTVAMAQDRRWQSIDTIRVTKDVVGTGLIGFATLLFNFVGVNFFFGQGSMHSYA